MESKKINLDLGLKHYPYPSIEQFRNVIYNVNNKSNFLGLDENNEPIFDEKKQKPVITFVGTVKVHGTNSAVIVDLKNDVIYYQSRENVITPAKDNAGFASYIASVQEAFVSDILNKIDYKGYDVICLYGEWAGSNIQKGVAINGLEKMFILFDVRLIKTNDEPDKIERVWLSPDKVKKIGRIGNSDIKAYNIYDFKTWTIDIDFNYPQLKQNELIQIVEEIEKCCPLGLAFGKEGTGEGVVFKAVTPPYSGDSGFWMKCKGEKHSASKVKTIAAVNIERLNSIKEFIELAVTDNRCQQSIDKLKEANLPLLRTSLPQYLRWIHNDIVKEEMDTILANGFEVKELGSHISNKAREWFFRNEINF